MASGRPQYHLFMRKIESSTPSTGEKVKPTVTDSFQIELTSSLRILSNTHSTACHGPVNNVVSIRKSVTNISCKCFFEEPNLLVFLCMPSFQRLRSPQLFRYFTFEVLVRMAHQITPKILELFDITSISENNPEPSNSTPHEAKVFPLDIEMIVDVIDEETVIEESMQENGRMIPASVEAISGLAKFVLPNNCSICLEEFHSEGVELSTMPCNHVFHHHCIVKWLQRSHVCPLCRQPMPIT